ncbi:MAG: hypothetical protein CMP53_05555 [Flavobacteriales bacterium]|nr:hypothetical protein [Flavobacteriales bacterium]|tara:strand:+ start:246 stop:545 length:300 start_codon:yes stop_codon:yes gene_type:complete
MVWMGSEREDDGHIPIGFPEEALTPLGNSDMANFNINNDAERLINEHPEMKQLGALPNLPAPRNNPMGLIANKKESVMLLGIGALLGLGLVRIWDHRTK